MKSAWRAFWLLLVWQYLRQRRVVPFIVVLQVVLSVGFVFGLTLLMPDVDATTAAFLATGAPTMSLLMLGLTVVPQQVSAGKESGRFHYLASLPVPRLATLAAEVTFWLFAQLPGAFVAFALSSMRFDIQLDIGWTLIPAVFLVALTAASVGYAIAMAFRPEVAQNLAQLVFIGVLLFSPINFPAERLPGAVQAIQDVLPVQYMGDLIRHGLVGASDPAPLLAFGVLGLWCVAGLMLSYRVAARRG